MTKKVLMVAYFFPPLGGVGSLRALKFAKYLPQFGWRPYVVTPKKSYYPLHDPGLRRELPREVKVTAVNYFDPSRLPNRLWQAVWGRLIYPLILVPDRQILWFWPALKGGWRLIKKEQIDLIWTTSSPASSHLIGLMLKKLTGRPWVADFRDEWTTNPFKRYPTALHRLIEQKMERAVLNQADLVITASPVLTRNLKKQVKDENKVQTLTNGYDVEDFNGGVKPKLGKAYTILHAGSLYADASATAFKQALAELKLPRIKLKLLGDKNFVSHRQAIKAMRQADLLLLILSPTPRPGVLSGKIFEYLAAKKPILALAPKEALAAKMIREMKAGEVASPHNISMIKTKLLALYTQRQKGNIKLEPEKLRRFERRFLTAQLATEFNQLIPKQKKLRLCYIGNLSSAQNQNLCRFFVSEGHEVHFITTKKAELPGVKSYLLPFSASTPWYFSRSLQRIRRIINHIKPDLVHGQDLVFGGIWAYLSGFRPYVATVWGSDVFGFDRFVWLEQYFIRQTLKQAAMVTGSSSALRSQAKKIGLPGGKWRMIHFGIDLKRFVPKPQRSAIIFCPRAIAPIYQTDTLIRAFAIVAAKRPNATLALLDNVADRAYAAKIKDLVALQKLKTKVKFWPVVENDKMPLYYNQAAVIVSIPSSDGCSVSFLESLAMGKKIVASELPYLKDWQNGQNFWSVPIGDPATTAAALIEALDTPAAKWHEKVTLNRQLVAKKAELRQNFKLLENIYRKIINE